MRRDRNGQGRGQSSSHRHPNAKLTEQQVRTIRRAYAQGTKARQLAVEHRVARQTIHRLVAGCTYREVTP